MVNDYFTPNIKAEVILDALLTDYAAEIIKAQCGDAALGRIRPGTTSSGVSNQSWLRARVSAKCWATSCSLSWLGNGEFKSIPIGKEGDRDESTLENVFFDIFSFKSYQKDSIPYDGSLSYAENARHLIKKRSGP